MVRSREATPVSSSDMLPSSRSRLPRCLPSELPDSLISEGELLKIQAEQRREAALALFALDIALWSPTDREKDHLLRERRNRWQRVEEPQALAGLMSEMQASQQPSWRTAIRRWAKCIYCVAPQTRTRGCAASCSTACPLGRASCPASVGFLRPLVGGRSNSRERWQRLWRMLRPLSWSSSALARLCGSCIYPWRTQSAASYGSGSQTWHTFRCRSGFEHVCIAGYRRWRAKAWVRKLPARMRFNISRRPWRHVRPHAPHKLLFDSALALTFLHLIPLRTAVETFRVRAPITPRHASASCLGAAVEAEGVFYFVTAAFVLAMLVPLTTSSFRRSHATCSRGFRSRPPYGDDLLRTASCPAGVLAGGGTIATPDSRQASQAPRSPLVALNTWSGPKSRGPAIGKIRLMVAGVRVGESSPPSPRAERHATAGFLPAKHREATRNHFRPSQSKHAFQRAVRLAEQTGSVVYRGRKYTAHQLGTAPRPQEFKCKPTPQQRAGRRLRCFCWNTTGLSSESYVELRTWLKTQVHQYDIVVVTETWWKHHAEWEDTDWRFIHTGSEAGKGAGVLIAITSRIAGRDIRHQTLLNGRLLHVRLHGWHTVDVLACYQKVWTGPSTLARGRNLWGQLRSALAQCPRRNLLLLLGDFNVPLTTRPDVTGILPQRAIRTTDDADDFYSILQSHSLQILNSYRGHVPPMCRSGLCKASSRVPPST